MPAMMRHRLFLPVALALGAAASCSSPDMPSDQGSSPLAAAAAPPPADGGTTTVFYVKGTEENDPKTRGKNWTLYEDPDCNREQGASAQDSCSSSGFYGLLEWYTTGSSSTCNAIFVRYVDCAEAYAGHYCSEGACVPRPGFGDSGTSR
jgi:hypothetical protein